MTEIQMNDFEEIRTLEFINWQLFKHKTILITGSTGLIGANLVLALAYISKKQDLELQLILPVRNVNKANKLFDDFSDSVSIIEYKLGDELKCSKSIDYIIHCASPTSSKDFSQAPVDVLTTNIMGTKALLEFARSKPVQKFIYLSSMEVYGFPEKGHKVVESDAGAFNTMKERNSYPIAKIACESLCRSYYTQYSVPTVVLRLTQTFGPGVKYDDGRVFAQFMRCAIEKKDIVLKTKGETERSYLYTADAVSAIITAMFKGESGEAYSVANPDTYCSIKEMAEMVASEIAFGAINVKFDLVEDTIKFGYANTLYMNLDVSKLMELGWSPTKGLDEMYKRMIYHSKIQ